MEQSKIIDTLETYHKPCLPMRKRKISLDLTMLMLTPLRLQLSGSLRRFMCKISTSPVKIFCIKSTSPSSGASSVDWRIS